MPLSYKLSLVQVLVFLPSFHALSNAAIIPSSFPAVPNIVPSAKLNVSTYLNDTTRCVLPIPPLFPVSPPTCAAALIRILSAPDVDLIRRYRHDVYPIIIIAGLGCFISLDKPARGGAIEISLRSIANYAQQVLILCQSFGQGGWTYIHRNPDWIVIVTGEPPSASLSNKEAGVGGDGLSLESRERRGSLA